MCKGLIQCNKVNGITPMNIHVQTTHLKLFALKKQQLNEVAQNLFLFMFNNQGIKGLVLLAMQLLHFLVSQTCTEK